MSTPVFVDPEISTQADGAQAPECPYHFLGIPMRLLAPPTSPLESTPPTLVPILCRTACMTVRVPPAMSSCLSASMAEVAAMFESTFRKRFRSSYKSSPSTSSPDLPSRKRYRGTSELVEDSEEDDDEEIDESLDFDSVSEETEDEGPTAKDEDPTVGDESLAEDEAVPEGQQWAAPVVETAVCEPLGLDMGIETSRIALGEGRYPVYLRQPTLTTWIDLEDSIAYIDVLAYPLPTPLALTLPSPKWSSGSLPVSPAPSIVPSPISSPMIPLTVISPIASPATAETEGFLTELGARVKMQGGLIRDHIVQLGELSPALFERYDRDIGELFTRSGVRRMHIEQLYGMPLVIRNKNWELRLQIIEERRARLDLVKIVDSVRRRQEPRGDV
ncbi:hypothetical protein Tco_0562516 [Tanacetum coccineum]